VQLRAAGRWWLFTPVGLRQIKDVFDLDQLNQQPAMAALLGAIDHVNRLFSKTWRCRAAAVASEKPAADG
jgi:hypothetical protein